MSVSNSNQCYYLPANEAAIKTSPLWVPCYNGTEEQPYVPCCQVGSFCLEGNLCAFENVADSSYWQSRPLQSPYYTSLCTDPAYAADDLACTNRCETDDYRQVTYDATNGRWECCGNATGSFCNALQYPEIFVMTEPVSLKTLASLPAFYEPAFTYLVDLQSQSLLSEVLTNTAEFRSKYVAASFSQPPGYINNLGSAASYEVYNGIPTTNVFSGPSALPASLSSYVLGFNDVSTMPITKPPTATPTSTPSQQPTTNNSSNNNAAVVGGAVGGALGGLLLIALAVIGFILFRTRRKRQNSKDGVESGAQGGPGMQQTDGAAAYDPSHQQQAHMSGGSFYDHTKNHAVPNSRLSGSTNTSPPQGAGPNLVPPMGTGAGTHGGLHELDTGDRRMPELGVDRSS